MRCIEVNKLNLKYEENILFNNITFNIDKCTLTCITTPSSKGKTTLLNIIKKGSNTSVNILDKDSKVTLINNEINFYSLSAVEELKLICTDIKLIKKYLKEFGLYKLIDEPIQNLSYMQMQKLNLIKAILSGNNIILIDNILSYFDVYSKVEYIGYLKKYQYENNITFIYTTSNMQDTIFCDKIIIIDKEIIYDGKIEKIYSDDKIIKKSGLNVSKEHELVEKLKLYSMVNNVTYTIEEVVDEICKLN